MAAPIAFRASSNAAFTQSDLKQRGRGAFSNPAEETQILAYETQAPSGVGAAPIQASPSIAIGQLNAMSFSAFPTAAFAAVPPSNVAYKIVQGRIGATTSDWVNYDIGDDGLPMARVIFPGLPLWRDANGQIGPSGVQLGPENGCYQMSYWAANPVFQNSTNQFLNVIRAQKSRIRVNAPQTGFLCEADIWRPWTIFSAGVPSEFFSIRNVRFKQDFTLNPFEYFPIPMPTNQSYTSPYSLGFCGSMVFAVYAETRADWSTRTGLST
jgi:hypothetical protein